MTEAQICMGDVVRGQCNNGRSCYALVERARYDFDENSDDDDDESLEDGCVHVAWYPEGKCQSMKETKLHLVDRSNLPRDIVRSKQGRQLGTVINVDVVCDVTIVGTDKTINKIDTSRFHHIQHLMEGEMVAYGPWLGTIEEVFESLIIRFPNGARARMSLESDEAELLGDVFPHPSDEGTFCDEGFQYFPGQSLSGTARAFRSVEWLDNGPRPKLRAKTKVKVLVEQVEVHGVVVQWAHRALSCRPTSATSSSVTETTNQASTEDEASGGNEDAPSGHTQQGSSENLSTENIEDARSDFEKFLGLHVDPLKPPPSNITGERLKHVKRILHFWKAHIGLGCRFLYQLTEEDARNLSNQAKPTGAKTKRSKRVSASKQKLQSRKVPRYGSSNSSSRGATTNGRIDVNIAKESDSDDSSADDEYDEDPPTKPDDTRNNCSNCNDGEISDEDDSTDGWDADAHDKIIRSLHLLTSKVGAFKFKLKDNGSGVNITVQNPHCPPKILRAIKRMLNRRLSKVAHNEGNANQPSLTTNALKELISHSAEAAALGITFDEDESVFVVTGDLGSETRPKSTEEATTDPSLCDLNRAGSDDDDHASLIKRNNSANKMYYCQSIAGNKHQAGKKVKYEIGQFLTVEVCCTHSMTNVEWQDGTTSWVPAIDLVPAHHVDDHDFCPGDFVSLDGEARPDQYGLVLSANNENRMVTVQWFRYNDIEKKVQVLNTEELSEYDIVDHTDFNFRVSDIILRLQVDDSVTVSWGQVIGELLRVTTDGRLLVKWSDGSEGLVYPQEVFLIDPDIRDSSIGSSCEDTPDDVSGWWTDSDAAGGSSDASHPRPNLDLPREGVPDAADVPPENNDATPNLDHSLEVAPESVRSGMVAEATVNHVIDSALAVFSVEQSDPANTDPRPPLDDEEENQVLVDNASTSVEEQEESTFDAPASQQLFSEESAPPNHIYAATEFLPKLMKDFVKALRRDLSLLRASLPAGIYVKTYDDRMDLLSVLIEGPPQTPYEDGIFLFDVQLPGDYPNSPPRIHYISYAHRLNPNLYVDGTVCVSLLGTWSGKGNEKWTEKSNLLQVLLSIQGLILNSEPYYNEAGYESHRAISEGSENSRCYNEMVILRLVEHMTSLLQSPPHAFPNLSRDLCKVKVQNLISRVNFILEQCENDVINSVSDVPRRPADVTYSSNHVDDAASLPSNHSNVTNSPNNNAIAQRNHADDVTISSTPSSDVTGAPDHYTVSSSDPGDVSNKLEKKPQANEASPSAQGRPWFDGGFPLHPLSKGVQLSLKGKLARLDQVAKSNKWLAQ